MGVRGLTSLINELASESVTSHSLNYFEGSFIAIDTSILLYKFLYASSGKKDNVHLFSLLKRCLIYLENGIVPVFVIEGKPPPEKDITIEKRKRQKRKIEEKLELLREDQQNNTQKINKLDKQLIYVTKQHYEDSIELLEALGMNVIKSTGEAEVTCASLQLSNKVDFTYSDDTDLLVLGCPNVLRTGNIVNTFCKISLNRLLESLDISFYEFVDMCILCGCDYLSSIPRMNHLSAYNTIKKYRTIENFLENNKIHRLYDIPRNFDYKKVRDIFLNYEIKDCDNITINSFPNFDEKRLIKFLKSKHIKGSYINTFIRKYKTVLEKLKLHTNFREKDTVNN